MKTTPRNSAMCEQTDSLHCKGGGGGHTSFIHCHSCHCYANFITCGWICIISSHLGSSHFHDIQSCCCHSWIQFIRLIHSDHSLSSHFMSFSFHVMTFHYYHFTSLRVNHLFLSFMTFMHLMRLIHEFHALALLAPAGRASACLLTAAHPCRQSKSITN